MLFDPELTNILRGLLPGAGLFFLLVTELGSDMFYVILLLTGYWTFKKRETIVAVFVLMISVVSNYWLKLAIANPRPPSTYWYPGADATNYSTPSGHAQNSMMLFGWIAAKAKRWWTYAISISIIVLVGISRIYLGVHYLEDVLLGWLIGLILVLILLWYERSLTGFFSGIRREYLYTALFILGLVMTVTATYVVPLPPGDNFGAIGGLIMGLAVALPLENRYIKFSVEPPEGQKWRLIVRVIVGLVLIIVLMLGLSPVMPSTDVWLRTLRYSIVVAFGVLVWPFVFTRLRL